MRSAIRGMHSPDADDLRNLDQKHPLDDFGVLVQVLVGPADGPGEESFDVMVCSPKWLARELKNGPLVGRHHLFLERWDFPTVEREIRRLFETDGRSWEELGQRLARFGHWEFEDYRPHPTEGRR